MNYHPPSQDKIIQNMLAKLEESMGEGAEEFLPELAPMYLEDAPPLITEISQAIQNGDGHQLKAAAHTLKGSSASMGINNIAALCQELEAQGKAGNIQEAATNLNQLENEFAQVKDALLQYQ